MSLPRRRLAFTLIELLVVIAIIAILIGMLLPAVQKVRAAAARVKCQNNLKQIATASHTYHGDHETFPPGAQFTNLATKSEPGGSVFVWLLPYLEQGALYQQWDFFDPSANYAGGKSSRVATVLPVLVCPADRITPNPLLQGGSIYVGITSYGGNGGTKSFRPSVATADGIFHMTGSQSQPNPGQVPVRIADVTDGLSQTLLFGERYHVDGAWDSYLNAKFSPKPPVQNFAMATYGAWFGPYPYGIGDVTMSGSYPINYGQPTPWEPFMPGDNGIPIPTPPVNGIEFMQNLDARVGAYGSGHGGGANFAIGDGSVRFIRETISVETLQALSTRGGGELVELD